MTFELQLPGPDAGPLPGLFSIVLANDQTIHRPASVSVSRPRFTDGGFPPRFGLGDGDLINDDDSSIAISTRGRTRGLQKNNARFFPPPMSADAREDNPAALSRLLMRLIDPTRRSDYVLAFAIGALPILCALLVGAARTVTCSASKQVYAGYLDALNWWSLAFLIPTILYALRWMMAKIAPVQAPVPSEPAPPILALVSQAPAKEQVYAMLRQKILSKTNLSVTLAIVVVVQVLDMWPIVAPYFTGVAPAQPDWSHLFLLQGAAAEGCTPAARVSKSQNVLLLISAYLAQAASVFIGIVAIILMLRHNLFFLGNIYQRRWVPEGQEERFFRIDPKDVNRCFGFRVANEAFNTQVKALMIAGLAVLLTRYANSTNVSSFSVELTDLFPRAGQWLIAVFWLAALGIVAMPGLVKLLPRVSRQSRGRVHISISAYLREFFSNDSWPKDKAGTDEPVPVVAARFAGSSFWPTGDNRAGILYFFSYWIFFIILLPPSVSDVYYLTLIIAAFGALAYGAQRITFAILKWSLGYIDELLVIANDRQIDLLDTTDAHAQEKPDTGIFISYRRKDSAEYARSLHKELLKYFKQERVFRDLSDIAPGENFVNRIAASLDTVDAAIVLIGPNWLTIADDSGQLRVHDPADMVHVEVATALQRGKRVLPVLVGGAKMPRESELPPALKSMAQINAMEISDSRWDYDTGRLIEALKKT